MEKIAEELVNPVFRDQVIGKKHVCLKYRSYSQEIESLGGEDGSNKNDTTLPTPAPAPSSGMAGGIAALPKVSLSLFPCLTKMSVPSLLNDGTVKPNCFQIASEPSFLTSSLFLVLTVNESSDYIYLSIPPHTPPKQQN